MRAYFDGMRPKMILTMSAVAMCISLVACVDDAPKPVTVSPTVTIRDMQFSPDHVTIEAGETVTWVWDDGGMPHDVSGDGFRSEVLTDGTFSHTFEDQGDFPYVCTLHSGMRGTVTVEG
jgi:plastocyanin